MLNTDRAEVRKFASIKYLSSLLLSSLVLLLSTVPAKAQTTDQDTQEADFNYVYSAVLGTGFYSTSTERVFVLRVPLMWTVAEFDEKNSLDLLVPISVGTRDILNEDGNLEIPDRLMTASFMPGLAWDYRAKDNWQISPSIQAGAAQDFQQDTTAWLYSIGLRSYAWWDIGEHRLGLGNRIVGAGQHVESSDSQQGFVLIENGLDWNYQLPWTLAKQPLSTSVFLLWQHFIDDMKISGISGETTVLDDLFQVGFTFGFRETITVWGFIPISRVGFSLIRGNTASGNELRAVGLNLGFPLSYF